MAQYKTPNVYASEESTLPPSVAEVAGYETDADTNHRKSEVGPVAIGKVTTHSTVLLSRLNDPADCFSSTAEYNKVEDIGEHGKQWYAIYTRPNAEKKLYERLKERHLEAFLPLRTVTRVWSDRKKTLTEPVFKSYLFVLSDHAGLHQIKTLAGFSHFLRFGDYPAIIPQSQIDSMKAILAHCPDVSAVSSDLVTGDKVQILSGALKGMEGKLAQLRGNTRVAMEIDHLGQSMLVTVPLENVVKLEG